eukprot:COSAG02_NODE_582_length_20017_cov_26.599608_10_plen_585_part_00
MPSASISEGISPQPQPESESAPPREGTYLPLGGDEFPDETLALVCCFLGPRELGRLVCVSRRFTQRTLTDQGNLGSAEKLSPIEEGAWKQVAAAAGAKGCVVEVKTGETWLKVMARTECLVRQRLMLATADPVDALWRQYASGDRMGRAGYTRFVMEVCDYDDLDDIRWHTEMRCLHGSLVSGVDYAGFQLLYTLHARDGSRDQSKVFDTMAMDLLVEEAKGFASDETASLRQTLSAKLTQLSEQRLVWNASVPDLISMIQARPLDASFLVRCAKAIEFLTRSSSGNTAQVVRAGGIDVLLAAMRAHPAIEEVQHNCARTLDNLIAFDPSTDPEGNDLGEIDGLIVAAGCIELLIAASHAHPSSVQVQEVCCGALSNLLLANEEHCAKAVAAGGIDVLIVAMRAYPSAELVQQCCASALETLSLLEKHRAVVVAVGAIDLLHVGMLTHPAAVLVQEECGRALGTLALSEENRTTIVAAGGIDVLTAAMRDHPAVEEVQEQCGRALGTLALSEENRTTIVAAGGIDVLTAAMRDHPAVEEVQEQCGRALGTLALSEENRTTIVAAGGIDVLRCLRCRRCRRCRRC